MLYSSFETQSFIYSCGESLPPEQTNKQTRTVRQLQ